jgi:phosphopantetheinyl transferase
LPIETESASAEQSQQRLEAELSLFTCRRAIVRVHGLCSLY